MNYAIVLRLLSYILYCEAALLLLPAMASLIYGEWMVLGVFLLTAALSAVVGALLHRIKPKSQIFYMREGFATTALCWLLISVVGAVPATQARPPSSRGRKSSSVGQPSSTSRCCKNILVR